MTGRGKRRGNARALLPPASVAGAEQNVDHEMVSYHPVVDLMEPVRELAQACVKLAREEQHKGAWAPDTRKSASAVLREVSAACCGQIGAQINLLKGYDCEREDCKDIGQANFREKNCAQIRVL